MSARFASRAPSVLGDDHALHIVARVGGERFAFSVSHVEEALDAPTVEWVPVAPQGMLGQLMHRGRMVPAWDAGSVFRLREAARAGAAVVLRDGSHRIALVVDDVVEMARIESADVHAVPGGADLDGVLAGVCFQGRGTGGKRAGALVNIVRVNALATLVSSRGTFAEGMTL